jgi:hypothetical protein
MARVTRAVLFEETFFDALFPGFQGGIDRFLLLGRHGDVTELFLRGNQGVNILLETYGSGQIFTDTGAEFIPSDSLQALFSFLFPDILPGLERLQFLNLLLQQPDFILHVVLRVERRGKEYISEYLQ